MAQTTDGVAGNRTDSQNFDVSEMRRTSCAPPSDTTCFEEAELAHWQEQLHANPALAAAMRAAEAAILKILNSADGENQTASQKPWASSKLDDKPTTDQVEATRESRKRTKGKKGAHGRPRTPGTQKDNRDSSHDENDLSRDLALQLFALWLSTSGADTSTKVEDEDIGIRIPKMWNIPHSMVALILNKTSP